MWPICALNVAENGLNWPESGQKVAKKWPKSGKNRAKIGQKVASFVPNGRIIKRHFFGRFWPNFVPNGRVSGPPWGGHLRHGAAAYGELLGRSSEIV